MGDRNSIKHSSYFIGVDGGGTKTKICVLDENGNIIGQATAGPGNIKTSAKQAWESFEVAALKCLTKEQLENSDIHVLFGSAGTESLVSVEAFKQLEPEYITSYELVSDAYIACIGAHGGCHGAIIIIGTGVIGYQLEEGEATHVGGWGFPHSDEGGGAWFGLQATQLAFKASDGRIKPSLLTDAILKQFNDNPYSLLDHIIQAKPGDFGLFAPLVIECAKEGDVYALELLKESGKQISQIAHALFSRQKDKTVVLPLILMGGLAEFVMPYVSPDIAHRLNTRISDTVSGAIWLLRRKFSL